VGYSDNIIESSYIILYVYTKYIQFKQRKKIDIDYNSDPYCSIGELEEYFDKKKLDIYLDMIIKADLGYKLNNFVSSKSLFAIKIDNFNKLLT
jgi:hypothetical protein